MADPLCLASIQQQQQTTEEDQQDHDSGAPTTTSPRRSLNLSQGLLGRRFSRTLTQARSPSGSASPTEASLSDTSIHVRIVPSIENPRRSLIFEVIDREIKAGTVIKIGRFTDRSIAPNHFSFKSKVVSRTHCELWVDTDGKLYIRDTKSSSGTFLNHVRLGLANQESQPAEICDGDIVQLGVDYQGGLEEMYRAVKMRFELNHQPSGHSGRAAYSMAAFQQLRSMTGGNSPPPVSSSSPDPLVLLDQQHHLTTTAATQQPSEVDECCICLYALAPLQALFVAPCSHCYHFKCIRPLLESYPGFQCPICRGYSDLEASVAIEPEEVIEKYGLSRSPIPPLGLTALEDDQPLVDQCERTMTQLTTSFDPIAVAAAVDELPRRNGIVADASTAPSSSGDAQQSRHHQHHPLDAVLDQPPSDLAQQDEEDAPAPVERRSTFVFDESTTPPPSSSTEPVQPQRNPEQAHHQQQRRLSASNLVDKLKMAFSSEKRKMGSPHNPLRKQRSTRYATTTTAAAATTTADDEDGFMSSSDDRSPQHTHCVETAGSSSSSSYASPSSSPPQRTGLLTRTLSALSAHSNSGQLAGIDEETPSFAPLTH